MKLCDSCSTPLPDNAHVCPKCGMVLPDEEDMTIQRLPIQPEGLLAGNIAVATDEEEVTIKGRPIPDFAKEAINKDARVPNPETPIPDMAILDRLPAIEGAITPQHMPSAIQNDLDGSEDIITDDPRPTPPIFQDSNTLDDDPEPVLLATDDPTPVAPDIQDRDLIADDPTPFMPDTQDIIADDPTPVMPGTPDADSIADDPTPLLPAEHEFSSTDDDPTPVGRDAEVITDDPSPLISVAQQDAEAISSDTTPQLEHDSDEAIIHADAPHIETDPRMLAAALDALAGLTAHNDPTPANGHATEQQEDTITSPDWSPYVAGEEITSKNRHTAPIPLYPDYGIAKAAFAPPPAQQTGDKTDGQLTPTMPAPLYENYQSFTGPTISRSTTASLMRLPQKIYTAYPQLLSRTGLVSLTLCLLLIISSIGLIIVRRPQGIASQNIHPTAAKLILVSNMLNAEVIKGSPAILPVEIGNSGAQPLHWTATHKNTPWLSLKRETGTIKVKAPDQIIDAIASTATLAEGLHNGSIQFHSSGGDASVQFAITVLPANGKKQPILNVDPPTLTFDSLQRGQQVTKTLTISNTGNAPLKWSANTDSPTWLTLNPASGTILAGGYPQPLVLTVNTATLPTGGSSAQLTVSSNASKTPVTMGITINVTPSNGNALTISTSPGSFTSGCLECEVTLTASAGGPGSKSSVNWSTSSEGVSGITFSPSSGTLLAGQSIPVKVTVPNTACPASAFFDFAGDANTVPVLWSCTPPPSPIAVLTASPTDLTNCTTCTVYISPASGSQSKLSWTSYSSGINGINISPSSGTVTAGSMEAVTITVPQQNCPATADLTFLGQGPNNSTTIAWSCTAPPPLASMLSVNPTSLDSSQCQANNDGTYNCAVTLTESPAGNMGWSSFSNVGGNFSLTTGQFSSGSTSTQVSINNIQCQDGTFGFLGSNNQVAVNWTCQSAPNLTIDTNNLSTNSPNCMVDSTYGYDCIVTLGESFAGVLNWTESDNLGLTSSQSSGQLTSGNSSQQVELYYIPCADGTITFSTPGGSTQQVSWICSLPTPYLTIDTTSLSPTSSNCLPNGDGTYYCVVNLGESSQGTINWSESDNFGSNSYISQLNGTLTPSSPTVQIVYYNIPCIPNGSITFFSSMNNINVSWTCSQPGPTPTQLPMLTVDTTSLSNNSSNCSQNSDGSYYCVLNLGENPTGTLNWTESDTLGAAVSQTSGTLTPSSPSGQIAFYNLPCSAGGVSGTITLTATNNTVSVSWNCTTPAQPTLTIDTNNLSSDSGNCSLDPSYGYDCTVTLGESFAGTLNWNESDNLGPYVSPGSGQLTPGSPYQSVTLYYLPCTSGTIIFSAPNSSQTVNWSCSAPSLTVDTTNLSDTSPNCSANGDGTYYCVLYVGETPQGTLNWFEYDDLGASVSQTYGTLTPSNSSAQIVFYNIPCNSSGGFIDIYTSTSNSVYINWSCSASTPTPTPTVTPNLSVNPSNIDPTNTNCSSSGNNIYSCTVMLGEDQSAIVNWNASDDYGLGVSFSQSSGTLSAGNTSQSITISNIPCQSGSFTFSASGANPATTYWSCTPSGPTPTPTTTPNLTVTPGNIDPTNTNCSLNGNNLYNCTVTLGEDQSATVDWSVNDDANLGVSFSQTSGTLSSGNPTQSITISNIPCLNGTFTFTSSVANQTTVYWSCTPGGPTPTPTATPNLSVTPGSIDPTSGYCSSNGNNIYTCSVTLAEDQSATVNWSVSDDNNLGVSFSQTSGTLSSGNTSQGITISNIPCQGGTFTFSGSGANPTTLTWSCSQPTPTPSPTATPNLSVSPGSIDPTSGYCSSNGNNIYSCNVTLSEDQSATVNWNVSDDNSLGVSFSQSSGTLSAGNTSQGITISNIPCQGGTFTFSGSGANPTTLTWSCSQPTPTPSPTQSTPTPSPTPSPTPTPTTANLSVNPSGLNTSNCSSSGNNVYSCTVTLNEDQPVTINWQASDDNNLGVSFSPGSGQLGPGNTSASITISNIPCQSDSFTFSGSGANNPVSVSWTCP